jgi:hypothetical protein
LPGSRVFTRQFYSAPFCSLYECAMRGAQVDSRLRTGEVLYLAFGIALSARKTGVPKMTELARRCYRHRFRRRQLQAGELPEAAPASRCRVPRRLRLRPLPPAPCPLPLPPCGLGSATHPWCRRRQRHDPGLPGSSGEWGLLQ